MIGVTNGLPVNMGVAFELLEEYHRQIVPFAGVAVMVVLLESQMVELLTTGVLMNGLAMTFMVE